MALEQLGPYVLRRGSWWFSFRATDVNDHRPRYLLAKPAVLDCVTKAFAGTLDRDKEQGDALFCWYQILVENRTDSDYYFIYMMIMTPDS